MKAVSLVKRSQIEDILRRFKDNHIGFEGARDELLKLMGRPAGLRPRGDLYDGERD
jgi:hypothetical protein